MSTSTQVILNGMKDWDDWMGVIRTMALGADVWDTLDPNKSEQDIKVLRAPTRPVISDVKVAASGQPLVLYSELDTDEREHFRQLQSDYMYDRREYDQKRKALEDIRIKIIESIKRDYITYTYNCTTVRSLLLILKDRIAPIDKIRERELIKQYKAIYKPLKA